MSSRAERPPAAETGGAGDAPGVAVFALAHHDDEVFCAGHIERHLAQGRRLCLLWATAGGLAPPRRRVAEGERVRRLLGLPRAACRDLLLPDQGAYAHIELIARELETLIAEGGGWVQQGPPVVYVPAYEGGHPDHDAVNAAVAVLRAWRPGLQAREFPLYRRGRTGLDVASPRPSPGTPRAPFVSVPLDRRALQLRRRLACANTSQLPLSLLPLAAFAGLAGRLGSEATRRLPVHDYARPPQRRPLLYELYTRRRFEECGSAALEALAAAHRGEAAHAPA